MNRPFSRLRDEAMLAEVRSIAPKIRTLADWKREFLPLAEIALTRGETLKSSEQLKRADIIFQTFRLIILVVMIDDRLCDRIVRDLGLLTDFQMKVFLQTLHQPLIA